jgi:hypothetical protein
MRLALLIGAALVAASTALHAQDDAKRQQLREAHARAAKACEGKTGEERGACMQKELCAQAKDPKACEERFAKGKAAYAKARQACEGKQGDARRECMQHELCAQAKDPAQCEARAKEAAAKRAQVREACKDKKGEDYRACIQEHRKK